jgi:hypothetical protein
VDELLPLPLESDLPGLSDLPDLSEPLEPLELLELDESDEPELVLDDSLDDEPLDSPVLAAAAVEALLELWDASRLSLR